MELKMKVKNLFVLAVAAIVISACGGSDPAPSVEPVANGNGGSGIINKPTEFCYFIGGTPQGDVEFTLLKNVKVAKGTFGAVSSILPKFEEATIARGGNSVVNFAGSQRFGFWPWRFIRPVASGRAINITNTQGRSCKEMGGYNRNEIINRL